MFVNKISCQYLCLPLSNLKNLSQIVVISLLGSYDNYCCHYLTFRAHATIFLEIIGVMTKLDCNLLTRFKCLIFAIFFNSTNFASCKLRSIVMLTEDYISLVLFYERIFLLQNTLMTGFNVLMNDRV